MFNFSKTLWSCYFWVFTLTCLVLWRSILPITLLTLLKILKFQEADCLRFFSQSLAYSFSMNRSLCTYILTPAVFILGIFLAQKSWLSGKPTLITHFWRTLEEKLGTIWSKRNATRCNNHNDLLHLTSLWKFQYFGRPIYNPVKHLWWSFYCKNSQP